MPKRLTPQQVEQFRRDGFLAPVRVLSEEQATYYRGRLEAFEAKYPEHVGKLDIKAYLLCPWVDELVRMPSILDTIEDLIGPNILCTSSNFRAKKPDRRSHAGWHQDGKYIRIEPDLTLIFVAFTEHTVDNGCLRFIPGSHQWGYLNHSETDPDPDSILDRQQSREIPLFFHPIPLYPGISRYIPLYLVILPSNPIAPRCAPTMGIPGAKRSRRRRSRATRFAPSSNKRRAI